MLPQSLYRKKDVNKSGSTAATWILLSDDLGEIMFQAIQLYKILLLESSKWEKKEYKQIHEVSRIVLENIDIPSVNPRWVVLLAVSCPSSSLALSPPIRNSLDYKE